MVILRVISIIMKTSSLVQVPFNQTDLHHPTPVTATGLDVQPWDSPGIVGFIITFYWLAFTGWWLAYPSEKWWSSSSWDDEIPKKDRKTKNTNHSCFLNHTVPWSTRHFLPGKKSHLFGKSQLDRPGPASQHHTVLSGRPNRPVSSGRSHWGARGWRSDSRAPAGLPRKACVEKGRWTKYRLIWD